MTRPLPLNTLVGDFGDVRRALQRIELNMRMPPLNNLSGSASAPTVTTFDRNAGYTAGSLWKDTTGKVHVLTNDATGASEWITQPVTSHVLLDGNIHSDTAANAVARGSLIYGNSTPEWDELVVGGAATYLRSDGTDVAWQGLNLVDDTSPELGGDLVMGGFDIVPGASAMNIEFDNALTRILNIRNAGAGSVALQVEGSVWAKTSLLVSDLSVLQGNVTIGDNSATDFTLTFNASANDGIITFDQDPGQFLFSHAIDVTGDIIVSGTVDGRDVDADGTKLDDAELLAWMGMGM